MSNPADQTPGQGSGFGGKTAIVTGAGSGIGRAVAQQLARAGARVVATDVNAANLKALADELPGARLVTVVGDIALEATTQAVVAAAGGRIDIVANVAGIMDGFLPAAEVDDATWDKVFAVNVTAVMRMTRAVLPRMVAAGRGAIVNVASVAGLRGSCAGAAYTASKHALVGFTKNTAFMYAPSGIRVNAVAPGAVITGIDGMMKSELAGQRVGALMPAIMPPPASAETVAGHICWLASDAAANITGAVLSTDGGWTAS